MSEASIKAIDSKGVSVTKEEYKYFLDLKNAIGEDEFRGLFDVDNKGNIVSVTPSIAKPTSMAVIFFLLNLMFNQKMRAVDNFIKKIPDLEREITELKDRINNGKV